MYSLLPTISLISVYILLISPAPSRASNNTTMADADNSTEPLVTAMFGSTTTPNPSVVPDVVLTLSLIGGCGLLGLGIAKLGDYCYDRHMATRDDISNASEYTKNILRTRLAVMKMKSDPPTDDAKVVKAAASAWIENTVQNSKEKTEAAEPKKTDSSADDKKIDVQVDVEQGDNFSAANEEAAAASARASVTVTLPPLPLPINKVSPATTESVDETPMTRANALPPITRPKTPTRSINQPIRSTR